MRLRFLALYALCADRSVAGSGCRRVLMAHSEIIFVYPDFPEIPIVIILSAEHVRGLCVDSGISITSNNRFFNDWED